MHKQKLLLVVIIWNVTRWWIPFFNIDFDNVLKVELLH